MLRLRFVARGRFGGNLRGGSWSKKASGPRAEIESNSVTFVGNPEGIHIALVS